MSAETYDKSFRFLEQDWENIYDRPKSSIAEYLRGMCEFAFSGIVPPKSERARFAGYNAVKARVMKGRRVTSADTDADTSADTDADTSADTDADTDAETGNVPCQVNKFINSLKGKVTSGAHEDVLTLAEVVAYVNGPMVSSNLRPEDPDAFAREYWEDRRAEGWVDKNGKRLNHAQAIRLIAFKLRDKKNSAPRVSTLGEIDMVAYNTNGACRSDGTFACPGIDD